MRSSISALAVSMMTGVIFPFSRISFKAWTPSFLGIMISKIMQSYDWDRALSTAAWPS